jgi:hypothetical protein
VRLAFLSVALGVPHLCLTYGSEDYNGSELTYFRQFYTPEEGSAFQFRGVSTAWRLPEVIDRLPARRLEDFAIDRSARDAYVRTFLTHDAGDGGLRAVAAVERAMAARGQPV